MLTDHVPFESLKVEPEKNLKELEPIQCRNFEAVEVNNLERLGRFLYEGDGNDVLSRDGSLRRRFERIFYSLEIMHSITDPDIKLFVVSYDFRETDKAQWLCFARTEEEINQQFDRFQAFTTFMRDRIENWTISNQPVRSLAGECHSMCRAAKQTAVNGTAIADYSLGDYHSVLAGNSIFFDDHKSWDHEIAVHTDNLRRRDVLVDFTIGDHCFMPFGVFRTKGGKIFSGKDLNGQEPTFDQLQEIKDMRELKAAVDGVVIIDEIDRTATDSIRVVTELAHKKWIIFPPRPSIATVLYSRTWLRMKEGFMDSGEGLHSHFRLERNWDDIRDSPPKVKPKKIPFLDN